ncbi:hypothetical protein ACHAWF_001878 [Thalassiosira exigua]
MMILFTSIPVAHALLFLLPPSMTFARAFQTSQTLPMRIDPIPKEEIRQRLGLKQTDGASSIGLGPNMAYALTNEHEVLCPLSEAHRGVLCTASLSHPVDCSNAESVAGDPELVAQAILSGSLAASVRSRCGDGDGVYYLPYMVTLVESLMADEMRGLDSGEMVFNSCGLETNEILMDLREEDEERSSVLLFASNTHADRCSATSDVYLFPSEKRGKVWKFCVEYKVTTINLQQILSFGKRDSATPLRPDVWLKDDSY